MSTALDAPPQRGETLRLEQRARLPDFLGLSLKNGLLNLVTLTLYRFWGKTEVRRRVWRTTYLNDEPLEYTGRGVELFMGFLFALAVIGLPYLLVVFGAQLLGPGVAALIVIPLYVGLPFVIGFGMFTAFRYLASRTVWRGVRFELQGDPTGYAWSYVGYMFLSGLTLGWYWPAASRLLAAPLWDGLRFGDRKFRFDLAAARRVKLYPTFALAWCGGAVAYLIVVVIIAASVASDSPYGPAAALLVLILVSPLIGLLMAPYQAARLRSVAAGVRFGEASFRLDLKWQDMAGLTIGNVFLAIVSLGFLMPLVQARTTRFLVRRLRSEGVVDLTDVRQAVRGPKRGEGLADAFGMAPI